MSAVGLEEISRSRVRASETALSGLLSPDADEICLIRTPSPLEGCLVGEGDLPAVRRGKPPLEFSGRDALERVVPARCVPEHAVESPTPNDFTESRDDPVTFTVAQDVEHRRIDDRSKREPHCSETGEIECVHEEELSADPPQLGFLSGLGNRQRREVDPEHVVSLTGEKQRQFARATPDIEYWTPDQSSLGQTHERSLWPADIPVRHARVRRVVDVRDRSLW